MRGRLMVYKEISCNSGDIRQVPSRDGHLNTVGQGFSDLAGMMAFVVGYIGILFACHGREMQLYFCLGEMIIQ